jgi:hypothetical protein
MNGSIMRLNAWSDLSLEFIELILATPPCKYSFCWVYDLYSKQHGIVFFFCLEYGSIRNGD